MRHRHLSNSFTRSGFDQHGFNHTPTEQPYFPTGRGVAPENGPGPFVGQMNHMTRHHHSESRSNVNTELQPCLPVDSYSHSSMTETRSLPPVGPTHCTNYNTQHMRDIDADLSLSHRPAGSARPLKRKRSGSFYSPGTSSSSQPVDFQSAPSYRSSLTISDEDSSRNVRRRFRVELDPGITRSHVPAHSHSHSHSSQFYHSAPGQHANGGQWNCVPPYHPSSQRRISPSEMSGGSRHEMTQVHIGGTSNYSTSSSHGLSRRSESPYTNTSRYPHYAHGGTPSTDGPHTPDNLSSRSYSRHSSVGGWRSSYRSGRPRLAVDRFPPPTESHMAHRETIMMVDQAPFYGNSRNFSDQYRDMRLDIDNMSYEDLLNLGERIGSVGTGLSEDNMSKYLMEKVHSFNENMEEVSCPICLVPESNLASRSYKQEASNNMKMEAPASINVPREIGWISLYNSDLAGARDNEFNVKKATGICNVNLGYHNMMDLHQRGVTLLHENAKKTHTTILGKCRGAKVCRLNSRTWSKTKRGPN